MEMLVQSPKIILRYSQPNKYDEAPYGTLCHVKTGPKEDDFDAYLQVRDNNEPPQWIKVVENGVEIPDHLSF